MPCALTPARRVDVGRVGIHPEVVAIGVAVKMEPQTVATDLEDDIHTENSAYAHYLKRVVLNKVLLCCNKQI